MTLTPAQLAARAKFIGSSDAAAILGFSPWRNAADVRLEKLGMLGPTDAGELAEIGTALEPAIADLAGRRLNCKLVEPSQAYELPGTYMAANIDRQIEKAERGAPPVEIKDSGIDQDWGDPGTNQVPAYVRCQVAHQLLCVGAETAHVARLGRGFNRGLFMYQITTKDAGMARMLEAMLKFLPDWWKKHVINRDPIEGGEPAHLEVLKAVRREPRSLAVVPADVYREAAKARAAKLAAEKAAEAATSALLTHLELPDGTHADGFECSEGSGTYFLQERRAYMVDATSFRVLRMKPKQG